MPCNRLPLRHQKFDEFPEAHDIRVAESGQHRNDGAQRRMPLRFDVFALSKQRGQILIAESRKQRSQDGVLGAGHLPPPCWIMSVSAMVLMSSDVNGGIW